MRWALLFLVFAVFSACNQQDRNAVQEAINSTKVMTIKGFYLEMDINSVQNLVEQKYSHILQNCQLMDTLYTCGDSYFLFDWAGLKTMKIGGKHVDLLFKVSDYTAEEYAQQFINSYGVPELTPKTREAVFGAILTSWSYKSPSGYEIIIDWDKSTYFIKRPSLQQRSFD